MTFPYGRPGLTHLSVLMAPVGAGVPHGIGVLRQDTEAAKAELIAYVPIEEFDRVAKIVQDMRLAGAQRKSD